MSCRRLWEAEALEDGRLTEADRPSFVRHASSCRDCQGEIARLASVREDMSTLPSPSLDALRRERLRARLLREANERIARVRRPPWARFALAAVAALVLVVVAGVVATSRRTSDAPIASPLREPPPAKFDVQGAPTAIWTTRTTGGITEVDLASGSVTFTVAPLASGQRFVVSLPDGQLEVRGTRFVVDVVDGQTVSVVVTDGKVLLRPHAGGEISLLAGERWTKDTAIAAPPPASGAIVAAPHATTKRTAPSGSLPAPTSSAGQLFDECMASFKSGDYARADEQFERFGVLYATDSRAEEAAYLRVVARSRMGDSAGAARLGDAYLAAYPNGLRRIDVQRIVEGARP